MFFNCVHAQNILIGLNDADVISYFKEAKMSPIAIENNSSGFVSVQFKIDSKRRVSDVTNIFAEDSLLLAGIRNRILESSGKWKFRKASKQKKCK